MIPIVTPIVEKLIIEKVENAKLNAKLMLIKAVIEENYDKAQELLTLLREWKKEIEYYNP